jgi:hypothetical protein
MAVATQEVFLHTTALVETWDVGAATPERTLVESGGRYGITKTDTVGVIKPDKTLYGNVKVTGYSRPGFSNDKATTIGTYAVGVAVDGTWEFTGITGVTTSTAQGTPIFVTSAGALTATASGNTRIGVVNYPATYTRAAGVAPIKIGA